MALKLNTGNKSAAPAAAPAKTAPAAPAKAPTKAPGGLSFIKRGGAAKAAMAQEEYKAEQRQAMAGYRRFWIPNDAETEITFLDGDLVEGILDIPYLYEHSLFLNGSWDNHFICTQDTEPCPICEGGSNASYVGVLTVIDHSEYTSKKDGKLYKDQRRPYVIKKESIKQLQQLASKCGGSLRGQRFSVSRSGNMSPSVGNTFFPLKKYTPEEIVAEFGNDMVPIDYEKMLSYQYLPAVELRKLGFGSSTGPIGSEKGAGAGAGAGGNFDNDM